MRPLDVADALGRDDMLAVDRGEGREAGVDACVVDLARGWVVLRDDDRAGAAAAFTAAAGRGGGLVFCLCVMGGMWNGKCNVQLGAC